MMNSLASLVKHPLIWCVFFLIGFIGGFVFQDHYGSPKTLQAVTIGKQKVKGDGNASTTEFQMNQTSGKEQQQPQKKNGIIRRVFGRRRTNSDSVANDPVEIE